MKMHTDMQYSITLSPYDCSENWTYSFSERNPFLIPFARYEPSRNPIVEKTLWNKLWEIKVWKVHRNECENFFHIIGEWFRAKIQLFLCLYKMAHLTMQWNEMRVNVMMWNAMWNLKANKPASSSFHLVLDGCDVILRHHELSGEDVAVCAGWEHACTKRILRTFGFDLGENEVKKEGVFRWEGENDCVLWDGVL